MTFLSLRLGAFAIGLSLAAGVYAQESVVKTWVLADGSMFEGSVAAVVPGQVTFQLKTGEDKVTPVTSLSQRSRSDVAEALGLGSVPMAAPAPVTADAPTEPAAPVAAAPAMQLTTGDLLLADGSAIDATDDARIRSLVGSPAIVVGTVREVPTLGSSGHRLVLFEGSDFNVFISKTQLDASADWIVDDLPGKRVQVSGEIELYREKPQIRGEQPSQLRRVK